MGHDRQVSASRRRRSFQVTGLVGYNCAQVLLADLGMPAPWAPPPAEQVLERLAAVQQ